MEYDLLEKTEIKKVPILVEINRRGTKKKRKSLQPKYSNTKIKARNFLTNLSYQRLNKNKHLNVSFVIECFSFITENLNPNSLERKFTYKRNKKYIYLLWKKYIPNEFYRIVCQNSNLISLNQLNATYYTKKETVLELVSPRGRNMFIQYFEKHGLVCQ